MMAAIIKWGGFAAIVGGVLTLGLDLWDFVLTGDQPVSVNALASGWIALHIAYLVADVLVLLALGAMWLAQSKQAGALGLVGFLIAFAGTVMLASLEWSTAFLFPWLAESAPDLLDSDPSGAAFAGFIITVLLVTVGWLLFGVASIRARVLPRGPVTLVMAGVVIILALGAADAPFIDVVWGLGLAWLGYSLWSGVWQTRDVAAAMG